MNEPGAIRIAGVLLIALALRLGWGLAQSTDPQSLARLPDQREYLESADNLLHRHTLVMTDPHFGDPVYAYRAPGYPLLIAASCGSLRWVRVLQAMLDTSTVLAVYLLARRWLTENGALLAAGIVAVHPYLIYFSGLILSETLFTAMLAWGVVLLTGRRPMLGLLFLAMSVLVRPSALALPVVLAFGWSMSSRSVTQETLSDKPLAWGAIAVIFTMLALFPWAWRNSRVLHHWVWTTTNNGITRFDGFNDTATGASDQRFANGYTAIVTEMRGIGEVERDQRFADMAGKWVRDHPGRSLELAAVKVARTWSPVPLSAENGRPLYQIASLLYSLPFDLLVLLGLGLGRIPRKVKVLLFLPAIYFTVIHAMSVGSLRYRLPVEPELAVLTAVGWQSMAARRKVAH